MKLYAISDVTFDHIAKEIETISGADHPPFGGKGVTCSFSYEEDIIGKLLSLNPDDLKDFDLIYIHSDQVFHHRPVEWQKSFFNTLLRFSSQLNVRATHESPLLVSNSLSSGFKTNQAKWSFGKSFDTAFLFSAEIQSLLERPNVFVFDFQSLLTNLGERAFYNYNVGHLYQMPYTSKALHAIAQTICEQAKWLFAEEKKVIVVDCDNTLWKGVVGEDGINGILCDKDAEGIIHYHFHEFLKIKKEEGFLLCINSKNNEKDVKEAFEKKNFVLKWDDFIIRKINWNDKASNMREIASELNVGIDSFIFIDDNKFELDSVKNILKTVTCVEFTDDYSNFLALTDKFEFKKKRILKEDSEKTEQYIKQQQRDVEEQQYENIDDFIKSLDIKMDIRLNDLDDLERLAQMTGKTNQFNFNKQAYNPEQLNQFIEDGGRIYSLKVSDKFGDYGTVGLIMISLQGGMLSGALTSVVSHKSRDTISDNSQLMTYDLRLRTEPGLILENYLMSCRALGKKIENNFFEYVLRDLEKNDLHISSVKFVKTEKNVPAETFYEKVKGNLVIGL